MYHNTPGAPPNAHSALYGGNNGNAADRSHLHSGGLANVQNNAPTSSRGGGPGPAAHYAPPQQQVGSGVVNCALPTQQQQGSNNIPKAQQQQQGQQQPRSHHHSSSSNNGNAYATGGVGAPVVEYGSGQPQLQPVASSSHHHHHHHTGHRHHHHHGSDMNGGGNDQQQPPRMSGQKRDVDAAASTDVVMQQHNNGVGSNINNTVAGGGASSNNNQQYQQQGGGGAPQQQPVAQPPPVRKQKITYALPSQNMEEGHFYVVLGEDVDVSTQRFKILSLLGEGTFGKVVEAWDRRRKEYCAVKIVRNIPKYTRDAEYEIRFMERIRAADPNDSHCLMKIQRHFRNDPQHVCIVMPKYGPCLLDHLQKHGAMPHRHLAEIIFHCGVALDFMHSELRLMHTDLKPENMLLESGKTIQDPATNHQVPQLPCRVRICDLGGCCDENHSRSAIVSTRHYRSPEVILGLGWMFSTDIWSMGCIIYELATTRLLYDTHENLEHLHMMERTIGRLPTDWAPRVREDCRAHFQANGLLRPLSEPKSLQRLHKTRNIRETIADPDLQRLILDCLTYDRSRRMTARQLCQHAYVLKYFPESLAAANHPKNRQGLHPSPSL